MIHFQFNLLFSFVLAMILLGSNFAFAYQDETPTTAKQKEDEAVEDHQKRILSSYSELEQKLLALREFEKENNPARSKLLQRAYELSQEQGTTDEMKRIVSLLTTGDLREAETDQKDVLSDLNRLLTLLQSEDRGKRIQDELKRNQEYLKEVERLLRIQKSLRGQAEGKGDVPRISKSQKQAAERAKKLADKIRDNEEQSKENESGKDSDSKSDGKGKGDGKEKGKGQPGEPKNGKPGGKGSLGGQPSDGESSEGEPSDEESQQDEINPVRKRVAAAEKRMRDAKKKLDQAKRDKSIKDMDEAIRELEAAKKELEEILRQLREEEVERTLSMLEGRFRKMMEREIKVRDQTKSLGAVTPEQRLADFEIKAGKLSSEQSSIATEASRALLLLREDGSSIAFPQTVQEMKLDMEQVASRLATSKVGDMTIEIENDIIETLANLIEALAQAQKENEANRGKNKPSQPGGGGRPGDSSLVGKIAEIRMLRALQDRIFRRHTRYAKMLDDPSDEIGQTSDPEILAALQRLTSKQKQLTEITKEIVESMNE